MYESWIEGSEHKNLKDRLKWHYDTYWDLLNVLSDVHKYGNEIYIYLKQKESTTNCLILTEQIKKIIVDYFKPKLEASIKFMNEFYLKSYQGFYCSICDGDNQ